MALPTLTEQGSQAQQLLLVKHTVYLQVGERGTHLWCLIQRGAGVTPIPVGLWQPSHGRSSKLISSCSSSARTQRGTPFFTCSRNAVFRLQSPCSWTHRPRSWIPLDSPSPAQSLHAPFPVCCTPALLQGLPWGKLLVSLLGPGILWCPRCRGKEGFCMG